MDTSRIPLPEEAISGTLKDMIKKKSINLEPEEKESKKNKRKSEKAKELSAAEKFSQFKKQRIEKKGEGDIVDDLFKDFIAKKMKEIDAERGQATGDGKSKGAKSVQDFSKILDNELKSIGANQPVTSYSIKSEIVKTETDSVPSTIPLPGETMTTVSVKQEIEPVVQGPSLPLTDKTKADLPESVPVSTESKKTSIGFRNFGIKLSVTSTELIKSGDVHIKGKRLEEGEVLSSHSEASAGSSSEDGGGDDGDEGDGEISGTGSISDSEGKDKSKKKKKKKKGKHKKKKKHKDKGKDGEKENDVLVVKDEKNSSKRKISITPKSRSKSPKKHRKSRSRSKEKPSRSRSRRRSRSKSRRSRSGSRSKSSHKRSRSKSRHRRSRSRSRHRRSRSRSRRDRSPSFERFWKSRYGHFDAYRYMRDKNRHGCSRSRSHSPDRESDRFIAREKKRLEDLRLKIDKAKLREIAIKNAVEMAKSGAGPNVDVSYKAGGKSVEELTDFCKRISNKNPKPFPDDSSSDEDTQRPVSDEEELIHHPFKVKEAPIVMDIRNAKQLPVVSPADRLAKVGELRLQFPVSSGSQHRQKEWVPVEKTEPVKLGISKPPSAAPVPVGQSTATAAPDKVFEEVSHEPVDISAIISERLSAVRKLAENPRDIGAKIILDQAQKKASQWANSRMLPGQFIGSTGASILSQDELIGPDKKRQAWLKKDVFTSAAPVKSGIGMLLLQKMGWKHGEGLGKNNEGSVEPLQLDVKTDRKGLLTQGEGKKGGGGAQVPRMPMIKDLSGKHPVSALVELCNKRKWGPPLFDFIFECGPDHKKNFLCKVKVNGTEYQPSIASNNKKLAKAQAATVCLQELGLVPRDGPI